MMKLIILVFLTVVAVQKSYAGEEFMKNVAECKTSEKATDADVMSLKTKVKPATREVKCLQTCLAEKMGLINNNQLSADGTMKMVKNLPNTNEKMAQSVTEILEECKSVMVPDGDRCENGSKAMDCLMDGATKRSMNLFM